MFSRQIQCQLKTAIEQFPAIVLTGPRQSGKTTLLRYLLPEYPYYSLESPDILLSVKSDPRGFLQRHPQGVIIDEAQNYPELFSYLQEVIDNKQIDKVILSGSQNFLMAQQVSQTLAGRAVIFELLPLTYQEYLSNSDITPTQNIWQYLYNGSYPRPYNENLPIKLWFESYIRTYLERDVRSLINVKDLSQFQLFLKFCAGQHGQEFNASAIANNLGISQTTAVNWLSILEASYILFKLPPYYKNYKKRLAKRPKLYFYDSAIVCHLLGIDSPEHLSVHSARGAIFEGFVISEFIKKSLSLGTRASCFFWREHSGNEVDLIIEKSGELFAYEIKSSMTLSSHFDKGLVHLQQVITDVKVNPSIIYAGDKPLFLGDIAVTSWQDL